jgi:hypothetical protein
MGEPIDPARHRVELIGEREAKAFAVRHHYSATYPAAMVRVGLFRAGVAAMGGLAGVAIFAVPVNERIVPAYGGTLGCVLSRFVLLDEVEGNGETWFLARALRLLWSCKPTFDTVVSYSDPVRRTSLAGDVVMPGHYGCIYQAKNAVFWGRASRRTKLVAPDGRDIDGRALSKLRAGDLGYPYQQVRKGGAPVKRTHESGADYVARISPLFRQLRHPGNYTYTFPRRPLLCGLLPYPKPVGAGLGDIVDYFRSTPNRRD